MYEREKHRRKEDFQYWLASMDDALEGLKKTFKDEQNIDLDFSPASLNNVEQWIFKNFDSKDELLKEKHKPILNKLAIYVGETFRKNIGGKWKLDIENEKSAYFKLPVLVDNSENLTPVSPHKLITATIDRRKGDFLYTISHNLIKEQEIAN